MSEKTKWYVTCPACGTSQFKTEITKSTMRCRKCGKELYINVQEGLSLIYVLEDQATGVSEERVARYADDLFKNMKATKRIAARQ